MLNQLMHNAWKFSCERVSCERAGGADAGEVETVRIRVSGERVGGRLRLEIRDHGSGFDMRYAHKLFEPFQRLHGSEEGAGNGIGLTIARQVAARHGGTIHAEAWPGQGASFHVVLRDLQAPGGSTDRHEATETRAA